MTRYIDADALKEAVNAHDYVLKDCFNSIDKGMFTLGIMYAIDSQPTIDAIPIEWILNNERMPKEGKGRKAIMDMLEDWRKEHDKTD